MYIYIYREREIIVVSAICVQLTISEGGAWGCPVRSLQIVKLCTNTDSIQ